MGQEPDSSETSSPSLFTGPKIIRYIGIDGFPENMLPQPGKQQCNKNPKKRGAPRLPIVTGQFAMEDLKTIVESFGDRMMIGYLQMYRGDEKDGRPKLGIRSDGGIRGRRCEVSSVMRGITEDPDRVLHVSVWHNRDVPGQDEIQLTVYWVRKHTPSQAKDARVRVKLTTGYVGGEFMLLDVATEPLHAEVGA